MVDSRYIKAKAILDASPLIYLTKLEALDVFGNIGLEALIPAAVFDEAARPALAYRHADAMVIERAESNGLLTVVKPTHPELDAAADMAQRVIGMNAGECQVLSVALNRGLPAVIFERRARSVARAMGVELLDVVELLIDGTPDSWQLSARIRRFAELVNMRLGDYEALRERIEGRRLR